MSPGRRFELQQRRLADARRVFLRAVRACPGCKQLWLDGFAAAGTSGAAAAAAAAAAAPGASTGAAGKGGPAAAAAAAGSGLAAEGGLTPREVRRFLSCDQAPGPGEHGRGGGRALMPGIDRPPGVAFCSWGRGGGAPLFVCGSALAALWCLPPEVICVGVRHSCAAAGG